MSEMAIQVKDLSKVYKLYNKPSDRLKETLGFHVDAREHYALKHVNFEIRKGETVGIIGTNGSGKSTILKIITGVLNPTGGEVNVDGRISALLELGAGFNMEYTGIENVYLNGTMLGFTKKRSMSDWTIFWSLRTSVILLISRSNRTQAVCLCGWHLPLPSISIRRS